MTTTERRPGRDGIIYTVPSINSGTRYSSRNRNSKNMEVMAINRQGNNGRKRGGMSPSSWESNNRHRLHLMSHALDPTNQRVQANKLKPARLCLTQYLYYLTNGIFQFHRQYSSTAIAVALFASAHQKKVQRQARAAEAVEWRASFHLLASCGKVLRRCGLAERKHQPAAGRSTRENKSFFKMGKLSSVTTPVRLSNDAKP